MVTGEQIRRLSDALQKAFPARAQLERMVRTRLNRNLESIAGPGSLADTVFQLISQADAEGWVDELVLAAIEERPRDAALRSLAVELGCSAELPDAAPARAPRKRRSEVTAPEQRGADTAFTWLHVSDLHVGQPRGAALWAGVQDLLRQDLAHTLDAVGAPIDVVFLTGDLAFSGARGEYDDLDRFLDRLFGWIGYEPMLFAVPGNHDLARPKGMAALQYRVLDHCDDDRDEHVAMLRRALWEERDVSFVEPLFREYLAWQSRRLVPSLARAARHSISYFPGDVSAVLEKDGFRLGLVGLNSSWAQYSGAEFEARLQMEPAQLMAALPQADAPLDFFPGRAASSVHQALLLMHHPPSWLSERSARFFKQNIYPPDRFAFSLFGHLHAGRSEARAISGGRARYELQAPSLFGLEKYGTEEKQRAFGYMLGRIARSGQVLVWPRRVVTRGDDSLAFDFDTSFEGRRSDGSVELRAAADPTPSQDRPHEVEGEGEAGARDPFAVELDHFREFLLRKHARLMLVGIGAGEYRFGLEDVYVPLRMMAREDAFDLHGKTARERRGADEIELAEAFPRAGGRDLMLFGEPGAGKTTALRKVLHEILVEGPGALGLEPGTIPVWLPLRRMTKELLDAKKPIAAFMAKELTATSGGVYDSAFVKKLWSRGKLLFLCDGLDEIADEALRARALAAIGDTADALRGKGVRALVSSRYPRRGSAVTHDGRFVELDLRPLSDAQVQSLAERWFAAARAAMTRDPAARAASREPALAEARALAKELADPKRVHQEVRVLAGTPLFLTLLCLVVLRKGELPPRRADFFRECLDVLLGSWPRARGHRVAWTASDALTVLRPVALRLHEAGVREAGAEELTEWIAKDVEHLRAKLRRDEVTAPVFLTWAEEAAGIFSEVGERRLAFAHLGIQEYLAAAEIARSAHAIARLAKRFGDSWWTEVVLLAVALPEQRVFDPLMRAVAKGTSLPAAQDLLSRAIEEAHEPSAAPFLEVLGDKKQPAPKRASILRALIGLRDAALVAAAAPLRGHRNRDLSALAARVLELAGRDARRAAGETELGESFVEETTGIRFLWVPGGRFQMGANDIEEVRAPKPVHWVRVSGFWLAETPVTNAQYGRFVEATGRARPTYAEDRRRAHPKQPVVGVSWNDAVAFATWMSSLSGRTVMLPSEAQWEFGARGTDGRRYPWGDEEPDETRAHAHQGTEGAPAEVGSYPAGRGPFGHLDLTGNVWEWCRDAWSERAYSARDSAEPLDPEVSEGAPAPRVVRGGAYWNSALWLRAAFRNWRHAEFGYDSIGFRVAALATSPVGVS